MPKKLENCVNKVQRSGKDESSAYAICAKSTGIKRKKGGGWTRGKKSVKESVSHFENFWNSRS